MHTAARRAISIISLMAVLGATAAAQTPITISGVVTTRVDGRPVPGATVSVVGLAPFGANSARFFTNAIDTRTNGVDATASYRLALADAGDVRLFASFNTTRTKIVGAIATPPQLEGFEQTLFDRIERRRIECGQPDDSVRAGVDWRRARWGADLNVARYGESCSFTLSPADDQSYQAKWLMDAEASLRVSDQLTVAAGGHNLFNVFPDRNITQNSFNGIQTFPSHSPFGMNGRTIYGRLVIKL